MTHNSSVTLIEPERLRTPDILRELIRAPKGPEHILFIAGSTELKESQRRALRKYMRLRVKALGIPYDIRFYRGHPGLVCFWVQEPDMEMERDWFDKQAEEGNYPNVFWYAKRHKQEED